ncbi:metallophosphoesterase family protein [Brevundimonas poindexterae]|uniref:metallophosphoesterase family protein n=1 Tax=Brevundimonas poindexterae TaxID=74325 RepID=UPI001CFD3593|nr:metallophosphoesterase [Brevundimonas poindexterae]
MGRIIQVSDVHFGCEIPEAVTAVHDLLHEVRPDLTLITGDITQVGARSEFLDAARWIDSLPTPVFVTVGNHDVPYWDVMARVFNPWGAFEDAVGHPAHDHQFSARFTDTALMVRGITTARGWQARLNWSKGVIDLDQTSRAAEALSRAPVGALRIVAVHHPLIEMEGAPVTGDVKRGRRAAQLFADAGVDLVLSGHVHVPFALPIQLGDHKSYAVGCGTLSHRLRGVPPSINRIEWDDRSITVTVLAFDGTAFVEDKVWTLARRQDTRHAETAPRPEAVAADMQQMADSEAR